MDSEEERFSLGAGLGASKGTSSPGQPSSVPQHHESPLGSGKPDHLLSNPGSLEHPHRDILHPHEAEVNDMMRPKGPPELLKQQTDQLFITEETKRSFASKTNLSAKNYQAQGGSQLTSSSRRGESSHNDNTTMYQDTSQDVGLLSGFSLVDQRASQRRNYDPEVIMNTALPVKLRLYFQEECIRITMKKSEIKIDFADIYAVDVEIGNALDSLPIVNVHTFAVEESKQKNCCGCTKSTVQRKRVLRKTSLLASSQEVAQEWHRRLLWAVENKVYRDECDPEKRKIMVLLNPFGGAGAARRNWAVVEPLFLKAHIDYQLIETQYAGHAGEIVNQQIIPGQFDAIVTVSGDGLIHEVVNGLLNRPDWNSKVMVEGLGQVRLKDTLTIGAIPGGTGNGLIKSLLDRGGENYGITEAAFRILKGRSVKMDITELSPEYNQADKKIYSFLSFAWSILADIDINSEAIRCCGATRFTVWGLWRTLFMRDYFGSIRYIAESWQPSRVLEKRYNVPNTQINKSQVRMESEIVIENDLEEKLSPRTCASSVVHDSMVNQNFQFFVAMNAPFAATDVHMAPLSDVDDGFNDLVLLRGQNGGKVRMARLLLTMETGDFFTERGDIRRNLPIDYVKARTWELRPRTKVPQSVENSMFVEHETAQRDSKSSLGNGPEQPVTLQDDPKFETDTAVQNDFDENSFFSIDGERYPAQNIKARVLPKMVSIFF